MAVGRAKRGASILEAGVAAEGTAVRAVGTAVGYLATAGCWARTAVVGGRWWARRGMGIRTIEVRHAMQPMWTCPRVEDHIESHLVGIKHRLAFGGGSDLPKLEELESNAM